MDKAETRVDALERLASQQRADIDNLQARIADVEQRILVHDAALNAFGDTTNLLTNGGNATAAKMANLEAIIAALVNDVSMLDARTRELIEKLIGEQP